MRANWNVAATTWKTIEVKNGQNAPRNAVLYSCKRVAAVPKTANRYIINRVKRSRCTCCRPNLRKPFVIVIGNKKEAMNATPLHHLQISSGVGLMESNSSPIMQRPSGRREFASKSLNRSLSIPDHLCTDSRRKTTTTPAKPARATAICAAVPRASPGSMDYDFNTPSRIAEELFCR